MKKTIFAFDQDGVIVDFENHFSKLWKRAHPTKLHVPIEERRNFYITDDYPQELHSYMEAIQSQQYFFRDMPPIPGAIEALHELTEMGHEVRICTSPLTHNNFCASEKIEWVRENLGSEWVRRIDITKDKTLFRADILVDDRPEIKGLLKPIWEHVIFDQPYNHTVTNKRRMNWSNWREVLLN